MSISCPSCGISAQAGARFCSACGAELQMMVLERVGAGPQPMWGGSPAVTTGVATVTPRASSKGRWAVAGGLVAALLAVMAWRGATASDSDGDAAASATTATTAEPSPETVDQSEPPSTVTTDVDGTPGSTDPPPPTLPPVPARVAIPPGLAGQLYAVGPDALVKVDLATGLTTTTPLDEHPTIHRLVVLREALIGLSQPRAVLRLTAASSTVEPIIAGSGLSMQYVELIGADDQRAMMVLYGDAGESIQEVNQDGTVTRHDPAGPVAQFWRGGAVTFRAGQVLRQFGQGIGLVDPQSGRGRLLMEGQLIAANGQFVVRQLCQADLSCAYHTTEYGGQDRWSTPTPANVAFPFMGPATVSPNGQLLAQLMYPQSEQDSFSVRSIDLRTGHEVTIDLGEKIGNSFGGLRMLDVTDGQPSVVLTENGRLRFLDLMESITTDVDLGMVVEAVALVPPDIDS
ncbi:MAG: zinc-ribbon domain-containing protein [Acidimicrobiales bacterium]